MNSYILSLELLYTGLSLHIIELQNFREPRTIIVSFISSPSDLKLIRNSLETNQLGSIAVWAKEKYSLTHAKITVSTGTEIKKWLRSLKRKENKNEN